MLFNTLPCTASAYIMAKLLGAITDGPPASLPFKRRWPH
ncbi:auxin Efflux Carrier domain protein [Serratia plymuthica A30]|nr:auxin Efflux Carrier domain protein [Serratia plymuthica A30]